MKKIIAMILAFVMVFSLAACGAGNTNEPADNNATNNENTSGYNGESLVIQMGSSKNEGEDMVRAMKEFGVIVEELSGGKIKVQYSWGGTVYDNAGVYEALTTGILHMDFMLYNSYAAFLPLMGWGMMPYSETCQEAIDQTNYMIFENETTSAIIQKYYADKGMTILGNCVDGAPSFITTFDWNTLDELVSKSASFGTMNTAKYQSIGLNCTACTGTEAYDLLDRGIVDGNSTSIGTALTNSLYEVAPYVCVDGQKSAGVLFTANTEWWNGLSDEARACIQEAVDKTSAFSAEYIDSTLTEAADEWNKVSEGRAWFLGGDDAVTLWVNTLIATANNAKNNAVGKDYEEDMKTLLTEWIAYQSEYHGVEIDWAW